MNYLNKYDEYINILKLETVRTFPLFLSKRLRLMLKDIDHEIARDLLSKHSDLDTKVKQTFVDIHDQKDDSITFIQPNKAVDILGWDLTDDDDITKDQLSSIKDINDDNDLFTKQRSETKWGRFLNTSFPGKYENSISGGQNKKDIESFVNMYKSLYNRDSKFKLMELVDGDDISYWYYCDHYYENDEGTLGDSCMKYMNKETFQIYTKNPGIVSLLVMYSDESKKSIKARAIVWNLVEPEGRVFMDRVYTNDFSDEQTYIDYAKSKGWLYKSSQSMGNEINIVDPINDTRNHKTLMTILNDYDYDRFPYCDTMTYFNPKTYKISNKKIYNPKYDLVDTYGSYYTVDDYEEEPVYVFSKYYNEEINQNDAKYCVYGDDYVRSEDAIRVYNSGGQNYAVPNHPDVVQSKFQLPDGSVYNKHFPKEKCIWSDHLNTWVFNKNKQGEVGSVKVWTDLNRSNFVIEHTKRSNKYFKEIDGEYWITDLVDNNGNLVGEIEPKPTRPVGKKPIGWHRKLEFIDSEGNIFSMGRFVRKQIEK